MRGWRRPSPSCWVLGLLALGLVALGIGWWFRRPTPTTTPLYPTQALVVGFLAVGQGEASWVKTPDGRFLVIGGGPPEAGAQVVAALQAAGAKQIDLLVLPYPYAEALGGVPVLLAALPVKEVLDIGWVRVNRHQELVLDSLKARHIPVRIARAGSGFDLGGGQLEVLFPTEPLVAQKPTAANNAIVLRLRWGKTAFLWEGGLEQAGEQALLGLGQDLSADVLRVGRFGNAGVASPELLRAVNPVYAVLSVGPNPSGLPAAATLERLAASGAKVLRTDQAAKQWVFFSDGDQVTLAPQQ